MSQASAVAATAVVSCWVLREFRKERTPTIWQPSGCNHSLWWAPRKLRIWKQFLAPDSWGVYQGNDFSQSRFLHLLKHRKALNSLTCVIWFSLIKKKKNIAVQITCPLLQAFCITWLFPLSSQNSSVYCLLGFEVLKIPTI